MKLEEFTVNLNILVKEYLLKNGSGRDFDNLVSILLVAANSILATKHSFQDEVPKGDK